MERKLVKSARAAPAGPCRFGVRLCPVARGELLGFVKGSDRMLKKKNGLDRFTGPCGASNTKKTLKAEKRVEKFDHVTSQN